MKLTLRVTLLTIMLILIGFTVTGLGLSSYWNDSSAADDLSTQILEQTSLRIDCQINELLLTANRQGDLNRRLFETGQFTSSDFAKLASFWLEQMRVHPKLTRLSLGLEADGEWYYVSRLPGQEPVLGELRRSPRTGKLELRNYRPGEYPQKPFLIDAECDLEDPRARQWYSAARTARKQSWSETYALFGAPGISDAPGVTCATPLYQAGGPLIGVLTASYSLDELCQFLSKLQVGRNGYAFVVEFRADGSRRVIAHPQGQSLLRTSRENGKVTGQELVPPAELADERVQTFLNQLPPSLDPATMNGIRRIRFTQKGRSYLGAYDCLSTRETPDWLICTIMPETDVFERVNRHHRIYLFAGLCVLAAAVLVSLYVSAQVAGPLEILARETAAIGRLEMNARPRIRSVVHEVDRLGIAMEEMKTGLRSFQKYVPADLVRSLLAAGREARLGGELRTMTIYFCDIANFTSISEALAPEQLVEQLGEYLSTLSSQILGTGGTVDKYLGDGIMAFWGAPAWNPQHALAACTAALRCRDQMKELRRSWKAKHQPLFAVRMGLHSGQVVVGNIGSEARLNYTVIGDAVNLASRLEGLNRLYDTEIMISESTYREAKPAIVARPLDWVSVKGKTEAVCVYELLGLKRDVTPGIDELIDRSTLALNHYRKMDWVRASALFEEVLKMRPADGAAQQMVARCRKYLEDPPGNDWDGIHRPASK